MESQRNSPFDRISELPSHILQTILMFLPLRDMARASILSKHWRYQWIKVPQLVFENHHKYSATKVSEILSLHHEPIFELSLDMTTWPDHSEIDKIILFLSRNRTKEVTFWMPDKGEPYKLPSSILSCVELRRLRLFSCVFQPLTLVGFNKLVCLRLLNVKLDTNVSISSCQSLRILVLCVDTTVNLLSVDAPKLKLFHFKGIVSRIGVMNTPHIKNLCLSVGHECFTGNSSIELINFLHSLPLLEKLYLSFRFLQVMAVRESPNDLLKSLNNLFMLELHKLNLYHMDELLSTLWFIRSSPNLRELKFSLSRTSVSLIEAELCVKMQERANYSLLKLQKVEMVYVNVLGELGIVVEFSQFLLDISPMLGTLFIKPADLKCISGYGFKRLVELACYPRASPRAKIVFADLESLNLTIT